MRRDEAVTAAINFGSEYEGFDHTAFHSALRTTQKGG